MNIDSIKEKAAKTAGAVGEKVESVVDVTKLRYRAAKKKRELDDLFKKLGKVVYEGREELTACAQDVSDLSEEIAAKEGEIAEMEKQIREKEGKDVCPNCGRTVDKEDEFCAKCGTKLG